MVTQRGLDVAVDPPLEHVQLPFEKFPLSLYYCYFIKLTKKSLSPVCVHTLFMCVVFVRSECGESANDDDH